MTAAAPIDVTFVSSASPTGTRNGAGFLPCQGLFHAPRGSRPRVGFLAAHYDVDFSEHYLAPYLARRGHAFLGWNTRFRGNGAHFRIEHALVDIGVGARWLREVAGVERVVLLGNSGGASLMAAYQAQATTRSVLDVRLGRSAEGDRAHDAAMHLPQGDAFVALCAHGGRPEVLTSWLDPSVVDESDPLSRDPSVDMFDAAHGPPYSAAYLARHRNAQIARNERITDWVLAELDRLKRGGAHDRLFTIHRTWADPRFLDLTIDPSERTVGCYFGDARRANYGPLALASTSTLRTWLEMWSLRTSKWRAAPHLATITVPSLVVQSMADRGCYPSDARSIHDALAADDRELRFIAGDHYLETPNDARDIAADLVDAWVRARWT